MFPNIIKISTILRDIPIKIFINLLLWKNNVFRALKSKTFYSKINVHIHVNSKPLYIINCFKIPY